MKWLRNLPAAATALLLLACLAGFFLTRDSGTQPAGPAAASSLIDSRLMNTASQMASLADTAAEQDQARDALRLADHELDQAFATALREAAFAAVPSSGPLQQLAAHVAQLKTRVAADQDRVTKLGSDPNASDRLELAKAQMALDQDELNDAQQDLARQGGDRHAQVAAAMQQHQTAEKSGFVQFPKLAGPAPATLREQAAEWLALGGRERQLTAAAQQASAKASALVREHNALESKSDNSGAATSPDDVEDVSAEVARLRSLSDQKKTLAELDQRIQDTQQLAAVYQHWTGLVQSRRSGMLHLVLQGLAEIFAIILLAIFADRAIHHAFGRRADRKRLHQLHVIARIAIQVSAALVVLFIIFGAPTQMTTLIGLATAGLTVALKDFIVAFFGWFVLMGRNGVRLGDWVEINGVGGEVIEIGLLKTVLLEMGNWTATGHPTGRRVAFMNGFALEGHYFNFSTARQWLWDELHVPLHGAANPYELAQQIRDMVERETAAESDEAQQEWERVTHQYGVRPFSARPTVDLRPTGGGIELTVRYITRAPQRNQVKSQLFRAILDLMQKPAETAEGAR